MQDVDTTTINSLRRKTLGPKINRVGLNMKPFHAEVIDDRAIFAHSIVVMALAEDAGKGNR